MKFFIISLLSVILILSSCTKTVTNPAPTPTIDTLFIKDTVIMLDTVVLKPTNAIVGLWIGTFTANNEPQAGHLYYNYDIREDGTILTFGVGADGNTYYSSGTWTLSGLNFSARYTTLNLSQKGVIQSVTAKYDSTANLLYDGAWQNEGTTATGTFEFSKVP
jgi:hypothetical protein